MKKKLHRYSALLVSKRNISRGMDEFSFSMVTKASTKKAALAMIKRYCPGMRIYGPYRMAEKSEIEECVKLINRLCGIPA